MDALSFASAGLLGASYRLDASASRVASGNSDLAAEAVEQSSAKSAFAAAAQVVRTSDEMLGSLLDILA